MKTIHIGPNESITITATGDSIELAAMLEASGALGGTTIAKARWLINDRTSLIKTLESVRKERDEARDEARDHRGRTISCNETVDACHRLLDSAGIDSDIITERIADIVTVRSNLVERVYALGSRIEAINNVIADFDPAPNPGADRYAERLRALLTTLTAERADLASRLDAVTSDRNTSFRHHSDALDVIRGLDNKIAVLTGERDAARATASALDEERADLARRLEQAEDERDALRPKPTGPVVEWKPGGLYIDGKVFAWLSYPDETGWPVRCNCETIGVGSNEESAMRLAELLAGHDPGGFWTVVGHTVPVDVVRAVCGSVAVGWEAA